MATLESVVRGPVDRVRTENMLAALARVVARGGGPAGVLETVSSELGFPVEHVEGDLPDADAVSFPVITAAQPLGQLRVSPTGQLSCDDVAILDLAADFFGVELVKARAALEAIWSMEGELLQELIDAGPAVGERLRTRARRAGIDLHRAWTHATVDAREHVPDALLAAARRSLQSGAPVLACRSGDLLRIALGVTDPAEVDAALTHLARIAAGLGTSFRAGLSSPTQDFALGARQASAALTLACQPGAPATVRSDALGSLRFLLAAPDTDEIAALVTSRLGPLAEHDALRGSQLVLTLETFLREGGNRPRTALSCHIHISTLKYRLGQISTLLGCPLGDAQVRFELMLAFELHRLLRFVGRDALDDGAIAA